MPDYKVTLNITDTFDADCEEDARILFANALGVGRYDAQVQAAKVEEVPCPGTR